MSCDDAPEHAGTECSCVFRCDTGRRHSRQSASGVYILSQGQQVNLRAVTPIMRGTKEQLRSVKLRDSEM